MNFILCLKLLLPTSPYKAFFSDMFLIRNFIVRFIVSMQVLTASRGFMIVMVNVAFCELI